MRINPRRLPFYVTLFLFALLFGFGSVTYTGFFSVQVFLNLFIDNAFLIVVAIGMTFVILSGGIDLSVGAVVALTTMISAALVEHHGWSIGAVVPLVLVAGTLFGLMMGVLIQVFRIQPFIVTLGGMFLARGLCYLISIDSISITNPTYTALSQHKIFVGGGNYVSPSVVTALAVFAAAVWLAHCSRFGRTVYALGGNERSALLMGLPVARTRILVYGLSGFCSALGGVLVTFYMLSGYGLHAQGMELDAIAATVVGGTLLTGGVGLISGSVVGVLLLGVIQSLITFDGTLSSWWARIAIGVLLCMFCLMQRFLGRAQRGTALPPAGPHRPAHRSDEARKDAPAPAVLMQSHAIPPVQLARRTPRNRRRRPRWCPAPLALTAPVTCRLHICVGPSWMRHCAAWVLAPIWGPKPSGRSIGVWTQPILLSSGARMQPAIPTSAQGDTT